MYKYNVNLKTFSNKNSIKNLFDYDQTIKHDIIDLINA